MWRHALPAAFLLLVIFPLTTSARRDAAPKKASIRTTRAVRAVLDAQVAAWNRGDIEGYMAGYWQSEETIFISGDSVTRGWQTVLARYQKGYDSREDGHADFF